MQGEAGEVDPGGDDSLVMVGVDANRVGLEVEPELAVFDLFELILVEVWPPPYPSVYHVREPFATGNLNRSKYKIDIITKLSSLSALATRQQRNLRIVQNHDQ